MSETAGYPVIERWHNHRPQDYCGQACPAGGDDRDGRGQVTDHFRPGAWPPAGAYINPTGGPDHRHRPVAEGAAGVRRHSHDGGGVPHMHGQLTDMVVPLSAAVQLDLNPGH